MIEFTLSRVSMIVCGLILLAAIIVPVTNTYDSMKEDDLMEVSDNVAVMLDSFWNSEADVMYLRGWDILPDPECGLLLNGHDVILTKNGKEYRSLMEHSTERFTMSFNDVLNIERCENGLKITYQ
ncbi:MAG: hypothetical protein KRP56_04675 [Candidatus Methanogranum gryphiswaldense]|nr:MAG: hypothetical protein KRP56_04675 [Candidatus Methanogranum sp. U3.2.1]